MPARIERRHRTAFNAGEWTPALHYRAELDAYHRACRTQKNFIPRIQGDAGTRPGTGAIRFVAHQQDSTKRDAAAFDFRAGDTNYVVTVRVAANGTATTLEVWNSSSGALVYTTTGPWTYAQDVTRIKVRHSYDVMYMVHPSVAPYTLTRSSELSWSLALLNLNGGPFAPDNVDLDKEITLTYGAGAWASGTTYNQNDVVRYQGYWWKCTPATSTGSRPRLGAGDWARHVIAAGQTVTVTVGEATFAASDVGRRLRVYVGSDLSVSHQFEDDDDGESSVLCTCNGEVLLRTEYNSNGWSGEVTVQDSIDGGTVWEDVVGIRARDARATFDQTSQGASTRFGALIRVLCKEKHNVGADDHIRVVVTAKGPHYAYITVTGYTSSTVVTGTLDAPLAGGPDAGTLNWAWFAFGGAYGYPSAVAIFEQRLWLAGLADLRPVLWASHLDDWTQFHIGDLETHGLEFLLDASTREDIRWLRELSGSLMIGTNHGVWSLSSRDDSRVVSGLSIRAQPETRVGAHDMDPLVHGSTLFYVTEGNRSVMSLAYDWQVSSFVARSITYFAEHLFDEGIIGWAIAEMPDAMLLAVTGDNKLLSLSWNWEHNVLAWSRHELGETANGNTTTTDEALALAVCALPRPGGPGGEFWIVTNRSYYAGSGRGGTADYGMWLERMRDSEDTMDAVRVATAGEVATPAVPNSVVWESTYRRLALQCGRRGYFAYITKVGVTLAQVTAKEAVTAASITGVTVLDCTGSGSQLVWVPTEAINGAPTLYDQSGVALSFPTDGNLWFSGGAVALYVLDTAPSAVNDGGSPLTLGTEYWKQANGIWIIPGGTSMTLTVTGCSLDDYFFEDFCCVCVPAADATEDATANGYCGQYVKAHMELTDMTATADSGGPGGAVRVAAVRISLRDSMGGELSSVGATEDDDGLAYWQAIPYDNPLLVGEALALFSGVKRVTLEQPGNEDGCVISVKTQGPRRMHILGLTAELVRGDK